MQRPCITHWLQGAGHTVRAVESGRACIRTLGRDSFDIAVLDCNVPAPTGLDVLKSIRSRGLPMPVILLTSKRDEIDVVAALESGADDYLIKPLARRELLARLSAVARRAGLIRGEDIIEVGPYTVQLRSGAVYMNGKRVVLSPRVAQLAVLFFRKQGVLISRTELLETVWALSGDVRTRTIDTHISTLRKLLELDGSHGLKLRAVYQRGYRLESDRDHEDRRAVREAPERRPGGSRRLRSR